MSVKRNSLSGLKALIDVASGSPTGGSTDDLGEGQVYVATIVREIEPGKDFVTKLSKHDQRTSRLYKIKLEEELGNSVTGGEILFSEEDELEEYFSCATGDDKEEIGNFCLNLLPEGVFIASETPEFPSVGDEVYATSDGGIEGRYLLSLKNSMSKGILGGHSQKYLGKSSGATGPGQAFKGANGKPVSGLANKNTDFRGDEARWSQETKLASLDPEMAEKVKKLMQALKARGFEPKIFYGWRSGKTQQRLKKQGKSQVSFSFHNATKDEQPASLAADIIDKNIAWTGPKDKVQSYRTAIGEEAKKLGLTWGGDWSFDDWAHVQLLPNNQLARVKRESNPNLSFA